MSHKPIHLQDISLSFPQKVCFSEFTTQIYPGQRIAVIGQNGCGKSTLLQILQGRIEPNQGTVALPYDVVFGYVPQLVEDFDSLSGGERFNASLTQALARSPNVLILDEPTNHLDRRNRRSLLGLLKKFSGTLIIVSHDVELLRTCVDSFWHIEGGQVHVFSGSYEDYRREVATQRSAIETEIETLNRQKKASHRALMKEQKRAKNSRLRGEKHIKERKWPTIVSDEKARRAVETAGKKQRAMRDKKAHLIERLGHLRLPDVITPKFSLTSAGIPDRIILWIQEGVCGYEIPLLRSINLSLGSKDRLAIIGDNGSGKSTLLRAIQGDSRVQKSGNWTTPSREDIGYLDQHYETLASEKSVFEVIQDAAPLLAREEIRSHLNDFLFRKNEEVEAPSGTLSGGEKARLSLAQIAIKTPNLLILDEMTNNLDLETREHVIQVLRAYPGALLVVSHDEDFLGAIAVTNFYEVTLGCRLNISQK